MEIATEPGKVLDIGPEQLQQYRTAHQEDEYALVDVRQPEEYQLGHIPGALLMPLGELDSYSETLKKFSERTVIFHCRSGGRSARAGAWAATTLGLPRVANLLGGFSGYRGVSLPNFPRLKSFEGVRDTAGLLRHAFELEKGTYQLYRLLASQYAPGQVADSMSGLANAELAHGKTIHRLLRALAPNSVGEFQEMFDQQPSAELIESGETFASAASRARELGAQGAAAVLEFAAEVEFSGFDLYRNLAENAEQADARETLLNLAQQEKEHAATVLLALGKLAAAQSKP